VLDPLDYLGPDRGQSTGTIVLDPDEFYILAQPRGGGHPARPCRRNGAVQSRWSASSASITRASSTPASAMSPAAAGARAVLEVRSREVPFILEHGQIIGRLVFERLTDPPPRSMARGSAPTTSAKV
jgi:dCTP deaminase